MPANATPARDIRCSQTHHRNAATHPHTPANAPPANVPLAFARRQVHDGCTDPQRRGRPHEPGTHLDPPHGRPRRRGRCGQDHARRGTAASRRERSRGRAASNRAPRSATTSPKRSPGERPSGFRLPTSPGSPARATGPRRDAGECTITLADTPGRSDFVGSVDVALAVADVAVVVVSAVDGVTAGTRFVWSAAEAVGLPRIVVITQEDKTRADFHRVLGELRAAFGDHLWPLELPLGEEQAFHGVADVLSEQALEYDESGRHHDGPMPADAEAEEHQMHVDVTEEIVSHDDEQLEAYLEGNEPSPAELERTLAREVASGERGARGRLLGRDRHGRRPRARPDLRAVAVGARARGAHRRRRVGEGRERHGCRDRRIRRKGAELRVAPNPDGEPLVYVFRTVADPFVGQVSMLKVLSGVVHPSDRLHNATTGTDERIHGLFQLRGAEHLQVGALRAGEVGAVAKLTGSPSGTLLWSRTSGTARPAALPTRPAVFAVSLDPGDAVRRREDVDGARAARRRRPDARHRPHRRPDRPARPRRHARRGRRRAARPRVRRARRHRARARRLSRDDRGQRRRRGQAQEAVRRPRAVRRGAVARLAAAAGRGVRVRRLGGRRLGAAHLHPGRREGRA